MRLLTSLKVSTVCGLELIIDSTSAIKVLSALSFNDWPSFPFGIPTHLPYMMPQVGSYATQSKRYHFLVSYCKLFHISFSSNIISVSNFCDSLIAPTKFVLLYWSNCTLFVLRISKKTKNSLQIFYKYSI